MALDLVEIAVGNITDSYDFEKLACEVMRDEGYSDIRPLGGVHDFAMDAVEERFFESNTIGRTVFQFTLQEYIVGKIDQTIIRLRSD